MSDADQKQILGLHEFEKALKLMVDKRYTESEGYLKETLKILKQAGQDKTLSYLYVLKRLAYVSFLDHRYTESEKYFKVCSELTSVVTNNPSNIFSSQKNLLLFYTYANIESAATLGEQLIKDIEDTLPVHSKELCFLMGVLKLSLTLIERVLLEERLSNCKELVQKLSQVRT